MQNGKITTAKVITDTDDIDHPKSEVITKSDPLGNVIFEQWGLKNSAGSRETYSLKYDYDDASRMTQLTYPDGQSVSYVYDTTSFGILKKINGPAINGTSGLISSFGYTAGGVLETINYGTQATTTFTFDLRGRPEQIKTVSAGTAIFAQKYEYDDLNNITSIKEPGDSDEFNPNTQPQQNFTYDQCGRLASAKYNNPLNTQLNYEYTYGYDGSDNRTVLNQTDNTYERYTYHAASGQVLTSVIRNSGTETFTHNAAGAMKERTLAGVTTEYSYDQAGRLKEVKVGSVPIAEYQYDAYGRLIKTTEGTQETIRLPMGNETAYEKVITPGMPTVERRYIIALGKYIARDEISAGLTSRVYYHGDHLGSTRALSGDDTGSFTYDPFGNLVNSTDDAAEHSHQFTGKPIQSTGLYYYGARFYDPTLGRFINMDPAKDGNNWWVYCGNNPLRYVDPTGCVIELANNATKTEIMAYERAIAYLTTSEHGAALIEKLENVDEVVIISFNKNATSSSTYTPSSRAISWSYLGGIVMTDGSSVMSPSMSLAHEIGHAVQHLDGELAGNVTVLQIEAANLRKNETPIAIQLGEPTRETYDSHKGKIEMNNSTHYRTTHSYPWYQFWRLGERYIKDHNAE